MATEATALSGSVAKTSNDASTVSYYVLVFLVAGLAMVTLEERNGKPFTALLWAFGIFTAGAAIGFLFGIPRVLQQDEVTAPNPPPGGAEGSQPGALNSYTIRVNTNLEQISDWLTKIFVGLGLIQLQRVPEHLNRAATFVGYGLGNGSKFFAGALIVYFALVGFLGFYLITRLYIAGAFSRADQAASQRARYIIQVDSIDVRLEDTPPSLTPTEHEAALNVVKAPVNDTSTRTELAGKAKALLSLKEYPEAVQVYQELLKRWPNDPKIAFEYAVALFYLGKRDEALRQMLVARQFITPTTDPELKKKIYRSLTFQALHLPPPDGFERAIKFGEEYVNTPDNLPSAGIWANLACGYGQKAAWLIKQSASENEIEDARARALSAAANAVKFGESWKKRIRELLVKNFPGKDPEDNDLEVFERDRAFRELVDLPPVSVTAVNKDEDVF